VVLKQAGARAPQVRLGTAALEVSRTGYVNARRPGLGNPYMELFGQRGTNGTTQGIAVSGTLWLPIELSGQRGTRIAEAEAYEDLFERSLEFAEASALGEVIAAYGSAQVAGERVRVLEQIVAMSKTTADIYEARLKAGDAILRDATIARVDLARNQVLLQDARGRLAVALADLNRLTGADYDYVEPDELNPPVELDRYLKRAGDDVAPAVATAEAEAKYYEAQRTRLGREAVGPFSLMLMGGRGDFGEARLGAGIAYEFPVLRSQQGEKARADAERLRSQTEASVRRVYVDTRLRGVAQQYRQDQKALEVLTDVALPAADEAVEASMATLQAGKDDWFVVLISRRDQAMLRLQRLDLLDRQWSLLGEMVQLTGELP
jgi:cobalt-zinc-cadmium efflux system outer membrane protein